MTNEGQQPDNQGDENKTVVYGTRWCGATQQVRRLLDRNNIPYQFRDMDVDPDAVKQVKWWTGGNASHPTIQIGGDVLVEPSITEFRNALAKNSLI